MAGSSSVFVAGLTAAALGAVGFLAYQASASIPADLSRPRASGAPAVSASKAPSAGQNTAGLPGGSGTGTRVVYSLEDDRVWLVDQGDAVLHTFKVFPSSVDPLPGVYAVTSRSRNVTGSDGIPIEHVVRFTSVDGVTIGFSAAVDRSAVQPDPDVKAGGIRQTRADGNEMWRFATIGRKVVVVR